MIFSQLLNNKDAVPEGELDGFPVLKREIAHEFLRNIKPSGSLGIYEYFPYADFIHDYMNVNFYKYQSIGVNKCKPYIPQMYYTGVNRWSIWRRRRLN